MMTLVALLTATTATCFASVGEPVAITSTPLSVETLGGAYRTDTGWPAPGEARIGPLRYDGGLMLRSNDPRFADLNLSPGSVHSRSSGCWFQWDNYYANRVVADISNARIGSNGYREGYVPPRPEATPTIPGYRFIGANDVHRDGFTWIGVWNAERSVERSQIIAFNEDRHFVLATLPVRFGAIAQLPDLHFQAYRLTLIGEGQPGHPVPWVGLIWLGETPGTEKIGGPSMEAIDLNVLREHVRAVGCSRGTPEQVARWREDLEESRANLSIEGMDLDAEDEALFAMLLNEGLSPAAMVTVIRILYEHVRPG